MSDTVRDLEGRRINAVTPLHLSSGEGGMLKNLLQEVQVQQKQQQQHPSYVDDENEKRKKQMLEQYQNRVLLHQMGQQQPPPPLYQTTHQFQTTSGAVIHIGKRSDPGSQPSSSQPMSHSQPCLVAIGDRGDQAPITKQHAQFQRCSSTEHESSGHIPNRHVGNTQKLVNSLREENLSLKKQIDVMKIKTNRLQQLEAAHKSIEAEYEFLMKEKEKNDTLEKTAFQTMENRMKHLHRENEAMKDEIARLNERFQGHQFSLDYQQQINKLNITLTDLYTQNESLKGTLSRQAVEVQAQRRNLEEQRTHIAMLETALSNAQDRLTRKEKMYEEHAAKPEGTAYLENLLHDAIVDKQQREKAHAEEKARLEMEIAQLKMIINKENGVGGIKLGSSRIGPDENSDKYKKVLIDKEKRITRLEKDVMDLRRKLHEEAERKKDALDAVSGSLEAKIKRLEDEKIERDRRIAELSEEKERLNDLLIDKRDEDAARRDLHRMEEMRQKIDERRRRHNRQSNGNHSDISSSATMMVEHSPTGSPSLRAPTYESLGFDSTSLLSQFSSSSHLSNSSNQFIPSFQSKSPGAQYSTILPHDDPNHNEGATVWNV
ncbi:unnamed protein product, partial [Mesorhabditis belari]|uniref:Uncharacterized protein n=1 Tax=Mesorhabditis belari TaxID=2138241 RepID=A0AAF3EV94_9BILA